MDAIKFHKELLRMTQKCNIRCNDCPLVSIESCRVSGDTETLVRIVEEWSNKNPELKPCPFCGSEPSINVINVINFGFEIECTNRDCEVTTRYHDSKKQAIESWNRRV